MRLSVDDALTFVDAKPAGKAGANAIALAVQFKGGQASAAWMLPEASEAMFTAFTVTGPEGNDSRGLPIRGLREEGRAYRSPGQVAQQRAATNRQMIVEVVERAD